MFMLKPYRSFSSAAGLILPIKNITFEEDRIKCCIWLGVIAPYGAEP